MRRSRAGLDRHQAGRSVASVLSIPNGGWDRIMTGLKRFVDLLLLRPRRGEVLSGRFVEGREVGAVRVSAVVLSPGEFAADELVDGRQGIGEVVTGGAEVFLPEELVGRAGEDGGHEAAGGVDPV